MAKVLVVEDDQAVGNCVKEWLASEQHTVDRVDNGRDALDRLKFYQYDVIILDLELPQVGGLSVLGQFRSSGGDTPVLILTGKNSIEDKERGLDAGADDYLTKPFHMKELSARVRAMLRRPTQTMSNILRYGDIELDLSTRNVKKHGKEIRLFRTEFALLEFFLKHPNQVFSSEAILDRVWSSESEVSTESVRTYIARLRSKIDNAGEASLIQNLHGVGYKFGISHDKPDEPAAT